MIVASGLLALMVGGAFGVLLVAIGEEQDASELSRHSELVLVAARTLERLVIDVETGERGLLRDRVETIGGRLEIVSAPGAGTSLIVTIPSTAADTEDCASA